MSDSSSPDAPASGHGRVHGRAPDELRPFTLEPGVAPFAEGSCLVGAGRTRVLCTATVEEGVPAWRESSGRGWVTGEYAMLPRSTSTRTSRERRGAGGRTREIERLIGRSLRSVVDMEALGPRTVILDCDVLQADGGTRTASITGAAVALHRALARLVADGRLERHPMTDRVAAVSVGLVDGSPLLDLDYREDVGAQVDMNVVATGSGGLVEVQGTAEGAPFRRDEMDALLDLALDGIENLGRAQEAVLASPGSDATPEAP